MALIKPSGLSLMGGTLRGALRFSGTLHPGLIVLSLTTAQRDALTPELGTVIFNVTTGDFEGYDGVWGGLGGGGSSQIIDTKANILALSPADPVIGFATDNNRVYLWDGAAWYESPLGWTVEVATPDMGAEQDSGGSGYGDDYITDKRLSHMVIGSNDRTEEGAIRVTAGALQIYLAGTWQDVVLGFRFREDSTGAYELEHMPIGLTLWYEVASGNSDDTDLAGNPLVQQYTANMGAYGTPLVIDGGLF